VPPERKKRRERGIRETREMGGLAEPAASFRAIRDYRLRGRKGRGGKGRLKGKEREGGIRLCFNFFLQFSKRV